DDQRDRLRDPLLWQDRAALKRQLDQVKGAELSPSLLVALGWRLIGREGDGVPVLSAAQRLHPNDFWLAFVLGNALSAAGKPDEALGYYRVALAVRPGTAAVYNNLGATLYDKGRLDEAIEECRTALALDPKLAPVHSNLGLALHDKGRLDEAIEEHRTAIALD